MFQIPRSSRDDITSKHLIEILYQLPFQVISPSIVLSHAKISQTTAITDQTIGNLDLIHFPHLTKTELWHHCMAHTNYQTLHQMFLNNFVLDFTEKKMSSLVHPCPSCMYEKHHKSFLHPIYSRNNQTFQGHIYMVMFLAR